MDQQGEDLGERWYKPSQVAEKLGVGTGRVLGWIHSGRLEHVDINAFEDAPRPNYRVAESAIAKLLESKQPQRPKPVVRVRRKPKSQRRYDSV